MMKKYFVIVALIASFLAFSSLSYTDSIIMLNPQGEQKYSTISSLDWNFDCDLDYDGSSITTGGNAEVDNHYSSGIIALFGITDQIDFYAGISLSEYDLNGNLNNYGKFDIDADYDALFTVGIKSLFYIDDGFYAGVDAQYSWANNDADITISTKRYDGDIDYEKWHIAPYISHPYETFSPYLGVRYTSLEYKADFKGLGSVDFENEDEIGVFLGSDLSITDNLSGNVEIGFIDQTSVSAGLSYKF